MELMKEQDGGSLDIVNENLEVLKTAFPEAFTEGGVNFDTLRQLLGDEVDEGEEKYGLNWHGKKKARQIALVPSMGTLRPCPEESVNWDTTQNLFVEGDNLEVLKLMQKSYAGKVKMIYIDPPYNTGKEFIYPDRFQDNLDTYLRYTDQKNDEGFKTSSNMETSGRFHTNWLNMMYPRLKLARSLLNNEGAIFISIDDGEMANLRKLCDEVFGVENFVANIIWQKKFSPQNDAKYLSDNHDHILLYARSKVEWTRNLLPRSEKANSRYNNPDNDKRGAWASSDLLRMEHRENSVYPITSPSGKQWTPEMGTSWRHPEDEMLTLIADNQVWFGSDGNSKPRRKKFLTDVRQGVVPETIWAHSECGHTQEGTKIFKALFEGTGVEFDNPKPPRLIRRMLEISTSKNGDIILDFFSGSCSTAQSILELNEEDGGTRKFIMVQLPEPLDEESATFRAEYKTIADIGKERIRRVAVKIKEDSPMFSGDLGFKVFELDSSNICAWNPDKGNLEQTLLDHTEHLVEGRSEEDVLYELLLKRGVDLTVPIEKREISGKAVYSIGYGVLFACLDATISQDDVENVAQSIIDWHKELEPASDTQVVFRDSAFSDDIAKTNMTAILQQNGIAHVRSL